MERTVLAAAGPATVEQDAPVRASSPRLRVGAACERFGPAAVVSQCEVLLAGDGGRTEFVLLLGGEPARQLVAAGVPESQAYWLRVWAARGLLWAGPGSPDVLRNALGDDSWRVREMVCKVAARHLLDELFDDLGDLDADPVPRVRQAARRALTRISQAHA